jgi:predicted exporter
LSRHPMTDRVVIDIGLPAGVAADEEQTERLLAAAARAEQALRGSGHFEQVGLRDAEGAIAAIYGAAMEHLPLLFTTSDLERRVRPRLETGEVRRRLEAGLLDLTGLEGVGRAGALARDPLGLADIVLERLSLQVLSEGARLEREHVISKDGRHLLLLAAPRNKTTDREHALGIEETLAHIRRDIVETSAAAGREPLELRTAGAYRATLDNERIVRRDTERALFIVTLGVTVLLLLCYRRPALGLMSILPATAGAAFALLAFSLSGQRLSSLALGFGGALIAIAVDQGVVFTATLDRRPGIDGWQAARDVRAPAGWSTLATAGAFAVLWFSGYPLLAQLGAFAAVGVTAAFLLVQIAFPLLFSRTPETTGRVLLVDRALRRIAQTDRPFGIILAALLFALMLPFAKPEFVVDLRAMSTVSAENQADDAAINETWGNVLSRVFAYIEAPDLASVQRKADEAERFLATERERGTIANHYTPSAFFPGEELAREHARAWSAFWAEPRHQRSLEELVAIGRELGFADDAFAPFLSSIRAPRVSKVEIPDAARSLLGLTRSRDDDAWVWLGSLERGKQYDARALAERAHAASVQTFDGTLFAAELGGYLERAFTWLVLVISAFVMLSVVLAMRRPAWIALAMAPIVFALVCTLGTLRLMGRPIDLAGLMLAIVVFGMGINFCFHLLRAYQVHPRGDHPSHDAVRVSVALDAGTSLVGMLSLWFAEHAAARSAGLCGFLGIGYSLVGSFLVLPPLARMLATRGSAADGPTSASSSSRSSE